MGKNNQEIYLKNKINLAKYKELPDEELKTIILKENQGIILNIINKNADRYRKLSSLSFSSIKDDLIQEGNIALSRAIEDFDPKVNVEFSTFAYVYVEREISDYLKKNKSLIKIPYYTNQLIKKIKKVCDDYFSKNKHYPSSKEIKELLNDETISIKKIDELIPYINSYSNGVIALSNIQNKYDIESNEYIENFFISDENNPEEEYKKNEGIERFLNRIKQLNGKEKVVFELRFFKELPYNKIAKIVKCSVENARQVYNRTCKEIINYLKDER